MKHPIKHHPGGVRFQCNKGTDPRYLLHGKKIQRGDEGGRYQDYGRGKKRYLLK